jgi:hypothetical protein
MQPTIKSLRQQGYKVRVIHKRFSVKVPKIMGFAHEISAKGGTTVIEITTPDKQYTVSGTAVCSLEDNFNHKTGNFIALGRALKQLEVELSNNTL